MNAVDVMLPHAPQKTVTRRGLAARVRDCSPLTMLAWLLLHVLALPATARADVTVDSAVTGPIKGDGGTFTVTATGAISGGASGVWVEDGSTLITTLTSSGSIEGNEYGLLSAEGTSIGTITNSGTIRGGSGFGTRLFGTTGTASNSGRIEGDYGFNSPGSLDSFTNSSTGVVSARTGWGFFSGNLTTFANEAGGLIEATDNGYAVYFDGGTITTVTNAGTIRSTGPGGGSFAVYNRADITLLTNSGTISGYRGLQTQDGEIATLSNTATALIEGIEDGIYTNTFDAMAVVNAGQITGGRSGIYAYYGISEVTNQSGGEISGTTGAGVYMEDRSGTITNQSGGVITSASKAGVFVGNYSGAVLDSLSNSGTIDGDTAGVEITDGTIKQLTNSGTIRYAGEGTGPAVLVGTAGILGVADGSSGVALTSTGAGASLDGTIENGGTIHYGFTIANQNVTVSAGGGTGTFSSGTLDVADGNLLFTSGVLALDADIAVDGGAGLFTNEATVALGDAQTVTGNFAQTAAGTFRSVISGTTTYGNLDVNGTAAFAGILDLSLSSFALAEGQTFALFEFNSRTGDFSGLSVDGTSLVSAGVGLWTYDSLVLQEVWTPTSMSIAAVPEPSTLALGAAGLASAAWGLRRRRTRA